MSGELSYGRFVQRIVLAKRAFLIRSMSLLFVDKFYHNITAWQAHSMRL